MNCKQTLATLSVLGLLSSSAYGFSEPPPKKDKHQQKEEQKEQKAAEKNEKKAKKADHKNGKNLLGDKVKKNGRHVLDRKGDYEADVDVKDGKVAGVHVKHAKKGNIQVTKYKSKQKMAMGPSSPVLYASMQLEYIDTVWIGFGYINEWGEEEIYWFPYDMIYDGDTGAIWYEPVY